MSDEKAGEDCGKSNRVLHTKQLPEKTEMDFSGTTRKDRSVRTTGEEIGVTNVPPGVGPVVPIQSRFVRLSRITVLPPIPQCTRSSPSNYLIAKISSLPL